MLPADPALAALMAQLERTFPVLPGEDEGTMPSPVRHIPWSVAERAYVTYSARHGFSQSLERLGERGGLSAGELDVYAPGWREEVSEIALLRAALSTAQQAAEEAASRLLDARKACLCAYCGHKEIYISVEPDEVRRVRARMMAHDAVCPDNPIVAALTTAQKENAALRENLEALQIAESHYRALHDLHGDGTALVGRAWDLLRRAGDAARALRSSAPALATPDPKGGTG